MQLVNQTHTNIMQQGHYYRKQTASQTVRSSSNGKGVI